MNDDPSTMRTATAAIERYSTDRRFRAVAQSIVSRVMIEHGRVDSERADRDASDIAIKVAVPLLETVFEEDAELNAMRHERDTYRKLAEDALRIAPMPSFLVKP